MSVNIEAEGLDDFTSRLEQAADALAQGITDALNSAADAFVNDAQASAPVDTGYLRDHIQITISSDTEIVIESEAGYSGFVEFGTFKMSAQPYFFQAADTARQELEAVISNLEL